MGPGWVPSKVPPLSLNFDRVLGRPAFGQKIGSRPVKAKNQDPSPLAERDQKVGHRCPFRNEPLRRRVSKGEVSPLTAGGDNWRVYQRPYPAAWNLPESCVPVADKLLTSSKTAGLPPYAHPLRDLQTVTGLAGALFAGAAEQIQKAFQKMFAETRWKSQATFIRLTRRTLSRSTREHLQPAR